MPSVSSPVRGFNESPNDGDWTASRCTSSWSIALKGNLSVLRFGFWTRLIVIGYDSQFDSHDELSMFLGKLTPSQPFSPSKQLINLTPSTDDSCRSRNHWEERLTTLKPAKTARYSNIAQSLAWCRGQWTVRSVCVCLMGLNSPTSRLFVWTVLQIIRRLSRGWTEETFTTTVGVCCDKKSNKLEKVFNGNNVVPRTRCLKHCPPPLRLIQTHRTPPDRVFSSSHSSHKSHTLTGPWSFDNNKYKFIFRRWQYKSFCRAI